MLTQRNTEYSRQKSVNRFPATVRPFKRCLFTAGLCGHDVCYVSTWITCAVMLCSQTTTNKKSNYNHKYRKVISWRLRLLAFNFF